MVSIVISGGQWGDEGKAKVTDLLSEDADYIIRYQGGANAGHTVCTQGKYFKFHLIPSGILFPGKTCIIGPGTVLEPEWILAEINNLKEQNICLEGLKISGLVNVTMPWHVVLDKKTDTIGSTGKGIGPTYTDKAKRTGIRVYELLSEQILRAKLEKILPAINENLQKVYELPIVEIESVLEKYLSYGKQLEPFVSDTVMEVSNARKQNKNILFEGAQGSLLDITFGTYPFVTSSNPISGGACIGAGVGPTSIDHAIGIFKSFTTRVGDGPFPSELDKNHEFAIKLRQDNTQWAEYGTTTGRMRRVGWFDVVLARYAVRINSYTAFALTKLDTLDQFEKLYVCTSYKNKITGEIVRDIAYLDENFLKEYQPVFQEFEGWHSETYKTKKWRELPDKAKNYLSFISESLEIPLCVISTGPDREDSILLEDVWKEIKHDLCCA